MNSILSILKERHLDFLQNNPIYYERMKREILEIQRLGQLQNIDHAIEIKNVIEKFNIPFFIRGSAGGSLVLYLLGFTDIDPIKHGIVFERFINEFRTTLGDIDFDLPKSYRDKIMKRVYSYYCNKNKRVGRLVTRVYYRMNSAIREAIRKVSKYRKKFQKETLNEILKNEDKMDEFFEKNSIDKNRVTKYTSKIVDEPRYISSHVGGITFLKADEEYIDNKIKQTIPLVNLDKNDINEQKRFKVDLLSNTGLDIINNVYPNTDLSEKSFPYRQEVFDLFGKGDVIGIVLGESPLIKNIFQIYHKRKGIKCLRDIANCLALIRPMARGENSCSDLIFDDDWIEELAKVLNISYSEADQQRKKLAKDDPCLLKKLSDIVSPKRLRQLMQIKRYGFCKAHAMNYARLLYCQAYAKLDKPLEFYCAVLNSLSDRIYADWVYFHDIMKHNIKIYAHKSRDTYIVKNGCIRPKGGVQVRLFPLSIQKELDTFGGITTLKGIEKLDGLVACQRKHKDVLFRTVLRYNTLIDEVDKN
jgi:DNA polymerase III subunit alpha